jgi:Uncharacterized protein conserved in bacteria
MQTKAQKIEQMRASNADFAHLYEEIMDDDGTVVPAVDVSQVARRNLRQMVPYNTSHPVGTIVVDPQQRYLFLVMDNGQAMRYGIGVAKAGLEFEGGATVGRKAAWPSWTPTAEMMKREPKRYGQWGGGMKGGIENPLGARALYLYRGNRDTLYRIHGTNEPWSIGEMVSSGCIRLFNQDILDLYKRVPTGSRVVVLGTGSGNRYNVAASESILNEDIE